MGERTEALARRIEHGARHLLAAAEGFSDAAWRTPCAGENRTVGVLVHHVASAYPAEVRFITAVAAGQPMSEVTWAMVDQGNARPAALHAECDQAQTLELLRRNSAAAAAAIRALDDTALERTASTPLHWQAPLTVQYLIEQHPIAHPYIHLESIRAALGPSPGP